MANKYGLLSVSDGLLWAIVAHYLELLGSPGKFQGFIAWD